LLCQKNTTPVTKSIMHTITFISFINNSILTAAE
jgi:hypothetical protein